MAAPLRLRVLSAGALAALVLLSGPAIAGVPRVIVAEDYTQAVT